MPVVAAAVAPASPLLLPGIVRPARQLAARLATAAAQVGAEIYARSPDAVVLVFAAEDDTAGFCLYHGTQLSYRFASYGDLVTEGSFNGAVAFTHRFKEANETGFPLPLVSGRELPGAAASALLALGPTVRALPVCPLQVPGLAALSDLSTIGGLLGEYVAATSSRVAVVAAGSLARESPARSGEADVLDQQVRRALAEQSVELCQNLSGELRRRSGERLVAPLTVVLRALQSVNLQLQVTAYERVAGTGLLTAYLAVR